MMHVSRGIELVEKLSRTHHLTQAEYLELLQCRFGTSEDDKAVVNDNKCTIQRSEEEQAKEFDQFLFKQARFYQQQSFGKKIYVRGLIEFTNYCRNNCYYCGIRRDNQKVERYRLTKEQILSCCEEGYRLGFRTFVLQGGEDAFFTDERMCDIVRSIKRQFTDCAVTLSIGERSHSSYEQLVQAGADRYLLRHETASELHYQQLHPAELSLANRKQCLNNLKELGFQTGAGFMVGSPGQTLEHLAEDLAYIQELQPHMVGIGPFISHKDTPFAREENGSVEQTLVLLSIVRLMLPKVLLPSTTALGTLAPDGRERGILAGANVVMPNLSPLTVREQYTLYDNKINTGEEAAQGIELLRNKMKQIGYEVVTSRGDYPDGDM